MSERKGPDIVSGVVQAAMTFLLATLAGRMVMESGSSITIPEGVVAAGAMTLVGMASVGLWAWRKRRAGPAGLTTDAMLAQRLAEVERREGEMDTVHARLQELEERLDFSERLLARQEEKAPAVRAHD